MSSELLPTSDSPGAEELSIMIPQSSGSPYRPPSIEGLEFSPLPPAVEDEPVQLFTPIEPSHVLFDLGTAEPPTWSLDDAGIDVTGLDVEAQDGEKEGEERPIQEKDTFSAIHSATNSTPTSIPSTPSHEPTPTLRPQDSDSPSSSLSTHTSTSSFSNQILAKPSSSSTNFNSSDNRHRKRLKRLADNRLHPQNHTSLDEEKK